MSASAPSASPSTSPADRPPTAAVRVIVEGHAGGGDMRVTSQTVRPRLSAAVAVGLALLVVAAPARAATSHTAYVANANDNSLRPIDTTTNVAGTAISVGSAPVAVAIAPDARTAYVANSGANSISVVDTATDAVTTTIPVGNTPF